MRTKKRQIKKKQKKVQERWIEISSGRLPKYDINVLLYEEDRIYETFVGYRDSTDSDGEKWFDIDRVQSFNPTHWMPLPNPPQLKSEVKKLQYSNPMPDTINIKWK